ncbi:hypothetical protein Taro_036861 [Colocasia esculenta]|uniref:Exportin-1 C-terminal domain-containing protein n=1 Tax=Colocasia esculenta TaxID=4460 RepID=A0A843W9J8_COLES|nr:hypothetical protein [Colocasia esculenta]
MLCGMDMACDTFLKIVQKCKRKFVITQVGENEPFVSELLSNLPTTVADLEPHQIHTFYESVGHMIQAEPDPVKRDEYLKRLMDLPNQKWGEIIGQASQRVHVLKDQEVIRTVLNILQVLLNSCLDFFLEIYAMILSLFMRITLPKKLGGLGLKIVSNFNTALLSKWLWRLGRGELGLWVEVIRALLLFFQRFGLGTPTVT